MSVLVDREIESEIKNGHIVIYPYVQEHLSVNSYDITLGSNFYEENVNDKEYNIWDKESVKNHWIKREAVYDPKFKRRVIWLPPGRRILGHTHEVIGTRKKLTTILKARSSVGRNGISICLCAGSGDVGYVNRWTLEITNHSISSIPLLVGMRIGQILFLNTYIPRQQYRGKYNHNDANPEKIFETWQPEEMLPKLYNDV